MTGSRRPATLHRSRRDGSASQYAQDRSGTSTDPASSEAGPDRVSQLLKIVSGVASALALLTALLYYFGWVRSQAQSRAFGTDVSVFSMTTPELVIRSADVLFVPLLCSSLLLVLGIWLHLRLTRIEEGSPHRRALDRAISTFGWSWLAVGVVAVVLLAAAPAVGRLALPFLFAVGVGGTWYAHSLSARLAGRPPMPTALFLALAALMAISVFWMTERVAKTSAQARAQAIMADTAGWLGSGVIVTTTRLEASLLGLTETSTKDTAGTVFYRYTGAYLLQRSGGNYVFLTPGWAEGQGHLVVLPENQVIRLEFRPGP